MKTVTAIVAYFASVIALVIVVGMFPGTSFVDEEGVNRIYSEWSAVILLLPIVVWLGMLIIKKIKKAVKERSACEDIKSVDHNSSSPLVLDSPSCADAAPPAPISEHPAPSTTNDGKAHILNTEEETAQSQEIPHDSQHPAADSNNEQCNASTTSEQGALENYISFDIETTGFSKTNDRIIEIAAIEYNMGKKVAEFETLVNPEMELPRKIISLTKISQEEVDRAQTLDAVIPRFLEFIGDKPLLGHNISSFDVPFLECKMGIALKNRILDTLDLARRCFPGLSGYQLSYLKDALQLNSNVSHRALADAETANALLWACLHSEMYQTQYNNALLSADNQCKAKAQEKMPSESNKVGIRDVYPTLDKIDMTSALCGKNIVFTGELSIPRASAMQMAVNAGAIVKSAVSSKTHYLVVGKQDVSLVGADGLSSKEEKAQSLNATGKGNIQIISEEEFAKLLAALQKDLSEL